MSSIKRDNTQFAPQIKTHFDGGFRNKQRNMEQRGMQIVTDWKLRSTMTVKIGSTLILVVVDAVAVAVAVTLPSIVLVTEVEIELV